MTERRLYNNLLALPLFLGMSRKDLQEVAGKTVFDFRKYQDGEIIVQNGDPCHDLYFLLNGEMTVITESDDYCYRIEEKICAPEIFQPEQIFGLIQRFTHTYIAKNNCSIMRISKKGVMKLSDDYEICRLNLLNLISTLTQKATRRAYRVPPKTLIERITRFFESHCFRPAGEKTFYIKMTRIAEELNDSRLDISKALNQMQSLNLLQLHRGRIYIPALEKLINH